MFVRFSMPRSPMRFFNCPMRAFTNPCRSFAYLYSAFSDRSPCARATAISLGKSTFNSWESWSISSSNFCFILASGSCMFFSATFFRAAIKKRWRSPEVPNPAVKIIDGVELRPQGAPIQNHRAYLPAAGHTIGLLDLDIQCLGLRVTGGILYRQGIGSVFFGRDIHAAVVRRPNR